MKDVVGNCFLCEEHSLHVAGTEESQIMQCLNCGYVTATKYMGPKDENEEYKKLPEDMKKWAKWENNRTWIPTIITLPVGMLYPFDDEEGKMKWAWAEMKEIPEGEQKNYPDGTGGYHTRRMDTDNPKIWEEFFEGMVFVNELIKNNSVITPSQDGDIELKKEEE